MKIELGFGRNFAGDEHEASFCNRFACHAAERVGCQAGVEHRVGDLVAKFIGMTFGHGLGRKQVAGHWGWTIERGAPAVNDGTRYDTAVRVATSIVVLAAFSCGGPPLPARGVVEADLGEWKFRRFQPVLDVEVWVEDNKAQAFTASYVADSAENRGRVGDEDVVSVFVTRYQKPEGVLRETVKLARRLAAEQGYQVEENDQGGGRALSIRGHGEAWVMWPAARHVVKVGGRGRKDVPESVVSSYSERYPSTLPKHALEGALPGGPEGREATPSKRKPDPRDEKVPYDPNNPRPDLETYDPKRVKLPGKKP